MPKELQPIFSDSIKEKHDPISLEKLRAKAIAYAPVFAVFIILSIAFGLIYLYYTAPVYITNAKVLINEDSKNGMSKGQVFEDFGMQTGAATVDNEVEILKSKYLMGKVVTDLNLNIKYYKTGRLNKTTELYKKAPFIIYPLFNSDSIKKGHSYSLVLKSGNAFTINDKNDHSWDGKMGDTIKLPAGRIVVAGNINKQVITGEFAFSINTVEKTVHRILKALDIERINKQVSILNVSIHDISPQRGQDIINQLMEVYTAAYLENKNRTSEATIDFIDTRLGIVTSELSNIELTIEGFKTKNSLTNLTEQSRVLLESNSTNQGQVTQQEIQLSIVESLESYLKNDSRAIIPTTFFTQDITLTNLIASYNALQIERKKLSLTNVEGNPYMRNIDEQIANVSTAIRTNMSSLKRSLQISINELSKRTGNFKSEIKGVPSKEREFLEYTRQQNIKQELYVFLLQKREETAINQASTSPNSRVIDPPQTDDKPVSPNKAGILMAACAIGLLIPATRVILKELFSIKVISKDDVLSATSATIIGEIEHYNKPGILVAQKESRSKIAEQFRALRTNLQFMLSAKHEKVIMLTSSMSGEGKSFISINLASTLSLLNKKVVLLELDLRKPKVSEYFNITNKTGFSNYVIGQAILSDIIIPSGIVEGLYIIPSGAIPPNPAELMLMPQVDELFEILKQQFDYVIIDTAPVGLVTDAQLLNRFADICLYIVRQNYTYKQQVKTADDLYHSNKLNRMNVVLNDVKTKQSAYGYGNYGSNYYEDDVPANAVSKFLKKIKKS